MYFDKQNLLSDDQEITATANSTNVIDLSGVAGEDMGPGNPLDLLIQVTEDFATLTSLTVTITTDDDVAFGSATTLGSSAAVAAASLVAGYRFLINLPASGLERYIRITYTVTGSDATAGKITAGIVAGRQQGFGN